MGSQYFFSYAREDSAFVLKLATELRAAGADLWLDQLDILGGRRWDKAVEAALQACPGMIACLSPASVASQNVMDEVSYALEEGKLVVPILLGSCTIPFRLRRVQYIDFTVGYEAPFSQLLRALDIASRADSGAAADQSTAAPHQAQAPPVGKRAERSADQQSNPPPHPAPPPAPQPSPSPLSVTASRPSRTTMILWIAALAYLAFAVLLLASANRDDVAAGYMFVANGAVLVAGCVAAAANYVPPHRVAFTAAAVQLVIMVAMVGQDVGDAAIVIVINVVIVAVFAAVGGLSRRAVRTSG